MYVNQGEKKKKVKETSAKYEGIVRWIREQIEAEELQPGERIESEYQLCDRFGVSRQTVRHAIAVLEKEGMIEKRRGSGTYIKESGIIGVRRKKTMQIAVMTTFVQEYIFSGIIQEIENKMSRAGYGIQIYRGTELIGNVVTDSPLEIIGRHDDWFYGILPADMDNESFKILKFML